MINYLLVVVAAALTSFNIAFADTSKNLPYPQSTPSADEIAKQVYFTNHFYAVNNVFLGREGKRLITVLVTRDKDGNKNINTLRRFLNNDYKKGDTRAKDMALFHSGKLMGKGMLITEFVDENKSQHYAVWMPAQKGIRNFPEPSHDRTWGGSDLTFGDVYLRKPQHETHELKETTTLNGCLGAMSLEGKDKKRRYLKQLHESQCGHKGKQVYVLKSTTKFPKWWYDYRVSYVDTKTFADYRTDYFKDGKKIKTIDRDWTSMQLADPRGNYWRYWYVKNHANGSETMINIPDEIISWNEDADPDFWSEATLTQLRK